MRSFLTFALALIIILEANGSLSSSRSGVFSFDQDEADYLLFLSSSVFEGYKDEAPVSFAEMPSFEPERGFWLSPDKDGYFVVWSEATTNLWYWAGFSVSDEDKPRSLGRSRQELVELAAKEGVVKFYQKRISREIGERIFNTWQKIVLGERLPAQNLGTDGVTVIFGAKDKLANSAFWQVWCPRPGSKAEQLMLLAHAIRDLVVENSEKKVLLALEDIDKKSVPPK